MLAPCRPRPRLPALLRAVALVSIAVTGFGDSAAAQFRLDPAERTLAATQGPRHLRLAGSELALDTSRIALHPTIGAPGVDWASPSGQLTLGVLAFEMPDLSRVSTTRVLYNIFRVRRASLDSVRLAAAGEWEVTLFTSPTFPNADDDARLLVRQGETVRLLSIAGADASQLRDLLAALALAPKTESGPLGQLSLKLTAPPSFSLEYTGFDSAMGVTYASADASTLVGFNSLAGGAGAPLLKLSPDGLRAQFAGQVFEHDGDSRLGFGYERDGSRFSVFAVRIIGDAGVLLMGEGKHSPQLEAELLAILRSGEAR